MLGKIKSFLFKNTSPRQTVIKNSFWLAVSNFGGRFIKAAIILYAARVLGTNGYGIFSYAVTLAGFLTLFMDPGVNSVLVRDVAKAGPDERRIIFSTAFVLKLLLAAFGVLIVLLLGPYFSTLPGAAALLPAVAAIVIFDTLREFLLSFLRGIERMEGEAAIYIFTNFAIVVFGFAFLIMHPTPKSLAWGYAAGTILGGLAAIAVLWRYVKKSFEYVSSRLMLSIIHAAWPFAVVGALGLLLTNTDILIISWLRNASDVGIYSAAIRIIQILYLVPAIVQISTLPSFARFVADPIRFRAALERTVSLVFLLSIPMVAGGILLGTQIISFLFGPAFAPGSLSFRLLLLTLLVDYPGAIIVNAIFAYGKQKSLIITSAIGGISNVLLDLILIPRFGITGSAVATLIAQTLSNGYLWYIMKKINYFSITPYLGKTVIATALMSLGIFVMKSLGVNVIVNIAISTIIYGFLLIALKDPLARELKSILRPGASAARAAGE